MSLINEALKKARQEAAQQEASRRGLPPAKAPAYTARRGGRHLGWIVVALAALGLAAWGGAWLARNGEGTAGGGGPAARSAAGDGTAGGDAAARPSPGGALSAPSDEPAREPSSAAPAAPSPAAPTPSPATAASPPPGPPAGSAPAPAAAAPETAAPETAAPLTVPPPAADARAADDTRAAAPIPQPAPPPAARRPMAEPGSYVREAPLADGSTLRLEGLAWSETYPTAVLNGQIVGRGERVEGVRVVRIERDRVVVDADGRELTIRMR